MAAISIKSKEHAGHQQSSLSSRTPRAKHLFYKVSFLFLVFLLICCCALLPIDILIQSTKNVQSNAHLAINAILVIACCVVFIVVSIIFTSYRFLRFYRLLMDIPKLYIPSQQNDFTSSNYYNFVEDNIKRCQRIYYELNKVPHSELIEHDGLSNPIENNGIIPNSLVYEDILRSIGDRIRLNPNFKHLDSFSFYEIFQKSENDSNSEKLISLYEKIRFSGKPINQDDFLEFLVEFVKFNR